MHRGFDAPCGVMCASDAVHRPVPGRAHPVIEGPGEEQVECVWLTEIRVWIFDAKQINTRAFVLCDWLLFTIGRDYLNWQGRPPIRKKITQRLRSGSAYSLTLALQNYIIFLFSHDID